MKKRVLIIEDDLNFADLVSRWLNIDCSFETVVVTDALQGLHVANEENWDLIISDINLPLRDGFEFVKEYKKVNQETPILMMTSTESVDLAIKALQNKVDDLLIKPFSRSEIVEKANELTSKPLVKKANKVILAIGSHPDDVEIGCGGTLFHHQNNGDKVHILTLSNGAIGGDTSLRKVESENAAKKLNASLYWGNLTDTKISDNSETIQVIENVIKFINPDIIYTHSKNDNHQDHRNTHLATIVASRKVENIFCYQSPSTTIEFRPTLFNDIEDFITRKVELIECFKTQTSKCEYLSEDLILSTAKFWGRFANYKKVEPFEVIKQKI
ncbi:MAG: PIG-L family deacetylase [Pyrinomonadaceae bacterium]|nr:PIG-L family deacetylase [Pyrinomonadaceae bacterium]